MAATKYQGDDIVFRLTLGPSDDGVTRFDELLRVTARAYTDEDVSVPFGIDLADPELPLEIAGYEPLTITAPDTICGRILSRHSALFEPGPLTIAVATEDRDLITRTQHFKTEIKIKESIMKTDAL